MSKEPNANIAVILDKDSCVHCFILDTMLGVIQARKDLQPGDLIENTIHALADFLSLHDPGEEKIPHYIEGFRVIFERFLQQNAKIAKEAGISQPRPSSIKIPGSNTKQ